MGSNEGGGTRKPVFKVVASVVALLIGVFMLFKYFGASTATGDQIQLWYYDLGANKLTRAGARISPTKTSRGIQVYRAYVFSCGECADESKRYIGWLEQFTEEAKLALQNKVKKTAYLGPEGLEVLNDEDITAVIPAGSRQVRAAASGDWVDFNSAEGVKLRETAMAKCGAEVTPTTCDTADFTP